MGVGPVNEPLAYRERGSTATARCGHLSARKGWRTRGQVMERDGDALLPLPDSTIDQAGNAAEE